ncbi:MAG: beta-galactosidase [Bacteroidaceae bacterium]|nr:beta-galactosidase [Bacteroidaceae bacterium]
MKRYLLAAFLLLSMSPSWAQGESSVPTVEWDRHSLLIGGRRVVPVMGEIHYSRLPAEEWPREVRKMKEGGITLIATYVFWNHIEEEHGLFDWSGQRNLRRFLEVCQRESLPVVLRVGPYCHGEVRCGGIPDWVFQGGVKTRSLDSRFLAYTETLYRQIFTQVQGLQWKDGGPVIACQFDNEFGGDGAYLMALKDIALRIGFDLPFYTRTGWPEMRRPTPFGEMIPLYGDYADGFWDRTTKEGAGNYWKAFHFKSFRSSTAIASEQLKNQQERTSQGDEAYPYFTCELGGGMMTSYHRRVYLYPEDAYSMALVKLGSGSNLLGYYMYHGGTNPEGRLTHLNEHQRTLATNYNDLPVKTYDFQAPLGEFGQPNPHYRLLRPLHLFMHDFGEMLAPMEAHFPCADREPRKHDDSYLRWSYRTATDGPGAPAFVFVNNYERLADLSDKPRVQFEVGGVRFPRRPLTVPASTMALFPVNLPLSEGNVLDYATAQPVACRDGRMWFEQKRGIQAEFSINGRVRTVRHTSTERPFATVGGTSLYLVTTEEAGDLFLSPTQEPHTQALPPVSGEPSDEGGYSRVKTAGKPRSVPIGAAKVAEEPTDEDFREAAVYRIALPTDTLLRRGLMSIRYRGDVARLYVRTRADVRQGLPGLLVADNFYNGRPMLMGLWRLPADAAELELRILPLTADMPVYFPREADTTPGEALLGIDITTEPPSSPASH